MSGKQKKNLTRILVALVLYIIVMLLPLEGLAEMAAYLVVYGVIGWDILFRAVRNITRGQIFDENFLMAIATVGAMVLGQYSEGVAVMLFYQVGEWFQSYAVGRSRRSIAGLMDIRPDYANLKKNNGELETVSPEDVKTGELIVVKPGERVPLDGVVVEGNSTLDTSALTGESLPRDVEKNNEVISGCINLTGVVTVQVTREYGDSTVARILELVENTGTRKAKAENFITRFARVYTPAVCIAALALAVVPPLLTGQPFGDWIYRALVFLVVSCPCALVISIPLSFFGGIGGASKNGVLVKGGNYLEALANTKTVVFDKTGTLTTGSFAVSEIKPVGIGREELLELAAYAENYSNHPIAQSIKKAYGKDLVPTRLGEAKEASGHGVLTQVDGKIVLAGNAGLMKENGIQITQAPETGTVVHLAVDGQYRGFILVEDVLRQDSKQAVQELRSLGITETVMLTGDSDPVGKKIAGMVGLDQAYTQLLPADKVDKIEELLENKPEKSTLVFVGDGVNDAPVLARADVGIAMGGLGSDAAIEAADVVIMTDEPSKIPEVIKISRKTLQIVKQNIVFALGIKALVLVLGALGLVGMWAAVFADVGVSVIAILNAMRALYFKSESKNRGV